MGFDIHVDAGFTRQTDVVYSNDTAILLNLDTSHSYLDPRRVRSQEYARSVDHLRELLVRYKEDEQMKITCDDMLKLQHLTCNMFCAAKGKNMTELSKMVPIILTNNTAALHENYEECYRKFFIKNNPVAGSMKLQAAIIAKVVPSLNKNKDTVYNLDQITVEKIKKMMELRFGVELPVYVNVSVPRIVNSSSKAHNFKTLYEECADDDMLAGIFIERMQRYVRPRKDDEVAAPKMRKGGNGGAIANEFAVCQELIDEKTNEIISLETTSEGDYVADGIIAKAYLNFFIAK